jgi:gamma-glutamyltranspeptidase/glutathione hydrolase
MGRRGAVASNHPLATAAGLEVLRAGGCAADAAVAVSLTLGVVEPHMSGLGGDGFYHHWSATTGRAETYAGTGPAPGAATVERYRAEGGIRVWGPLSTQTPGKLAGLAALHAEHGAKPWAALFGPAIEAARHGFAATAPVRRFGPPIRIFIERRLTLVTTVFAICLVGGFAVVKYLMPAQ